MSDDPVESIDEDVPPLLALGRPRVRRAPGSDPRAVPSGQPAGAPFAPHDASVGPRPSVGPVRAASVRRKLGAMASRWPVTLDGESRTSRPNDQSGIPRSHASGPIVNDDEAPTHAMPREDFDPFADPRRPPSTTPVAVLRSLAPVPHFRPARPADVATAIIPSARSSARPTRTIRAPLAVWLVASVIAGLVSYRVAPDVMAKLEPPTRSAAP